MVKTVIAINSNMTSGSRRDYWKETREIISELTALKHKLADLSEAVEVRDEDCGRMDEALDALDDAIDILGDIVEG